MCVKVKSEPSARVPQLVGIPGLCRALSISKAGAYNLMAAGSLPFLKIGNRRMFDVRDIESFIANGKREAA